MSRKRHPPATPAAAEDRADTTAEPLAIDARFVAAREVLARARGRVTVEDVRRNVPNDPGAPAYFAAFVDILDRGEPALSREFAVTETIALTRWTHADSMADPARFRWFRVLTCAVEVLIEPPDWSPIGLTALLVDSFALEEAGDTAAPTDLLSAVCKEIKAQPQRTHRGDERTFGLLGELLLATHDGLDHAAIEALCAALEAHDRRYRMWWEFEGAHWSDQPRSDAFLWSLASHTELYAVWLDLVAKRFPVEPPAAAAMKQRLLTDGARWSHQRRVLS